MKTRVTELLGVEYPIILGGLHWLGNAELAVAVSEAGGFGLITAGTYRDKEEFRDEIRKARELTRKPFGINITLGTRRRMDEFFEAAIEEQVPAVFTSGHNPVDFVKGLKDAGIKLVHVSASISHALKAESFGADAVVLVGFEAGGHPGMDEVTLMAMIPKASKMLKIPLIAAGGVADGRSFAAALAMGAEGAQIGTRFVATRECMVHPAVKDAIVAANETDTMITLRSMRAALRVLHTPVAERVRGIESCAGCVDDILCLIGGDATFKAVREGAMDQGVVSVGQCIGSIDEILSVSEVMQKIVREAEERMESLNGMFR
jgi:nitronate monooxygenase